jgi:hypothetical protein
MAEAENKAKLEQFVELYEKREELKTQSREVNAEFKALNDWVHEVLMTQPVGHTVVLNQPPGRSWKRTQYGIKLKSKTKVGGLNSALIGNAYTEFQTNFSKRIVTEQEREAYLEAIKQMRNSKKEITQEVHFVKT